MVLCWVSRVLGTGDMGDVRNEGLPGFLSHLEDAPGPEVPRMEQLSHEVPRITFPEHERLLS